jgi:hypothetical protein
MRETGGCALDPALAIAAKVLTTGLVHGSDRRLRARLTLGSKLREVIALSAVEQLAMAAPGQVHA